MLVRPDAQSWAASKLLEALEGQQGTRPPCRDPLMPQKSAEPLPLSDPRVVVAVRPRKSRRAGLRLCDLRARASFGTALPAGLARPFGGCPRNVATTGRPRSWAMDHVNAAGIGLAHDAPPAPVQSARRRVGRLTAWLTDAGMPPGRHRPIPQEYSLGSSKRWRPFKAWPTARDRLRDRPPTDSDARRT